MKKILVAFDGSVFSEGVLQYAFHFSDNNKAMMVGVFIEDLSYIGYASLFGEDYFTFNPALIEKMEHEAEGKINESITKFEAICKEKNISYKVHLDKGVPVNELVHESLFADLIVIGYQTFFSNIAGEASFLKDILSDAQCPVIVVPEQFRPVQSMLLTFDGKAPSVFSIRQFTQLFSSLAADLPITLLSIIKANENQPDDEELMKEYLSVHYKMVTYQTLKGQPDEAILNVSATMNNPLIVMGAFGRSNVSRLFARSTARKLLHDQSLPIFVSHR